MEVLKFLADIGNSEINSRHKISKRGYLYNHKARMDLRRSSALCISLQEMFKPHGKGRTWLCSMFHVECGPPRLFSNGHTVSRCLVGCHEEVSPGTGSLSNWTHRVPYYETEHRFNYVLSLMATYTIYVERKRSQR